MPTSDAPRCLATRLMCSVITLGSATSVRTGFIRPRGAPAMCDSIALRRSADVLAVAIRPSGSRDVRLKYQLCSGLPSSPRLFFSWGVCEASTERQSPTTRTLRPRYGIGSHTASSFRSSSFVTIGDLPVHVRVTRDTIPQISLLGLRDAHTGARIMSEKRRMDRNEPVFRKTIPQGWGGSRFHRTPRPPSSGSPPS